MTGLFDYDRFVECLSGPNAVIEDLNCNCFDSDADNDVGLVDFGLFQLAFDDR